MSTLDHAAVPVAETEELVVAPSSDIGAPSAARAAYLARRRRTGILVGSIQVAILVAAIGVWQLAAVRGWVDPLLTSRPTAVWSTLQRLAATGELWTHVRVTLTETVLGFTLGMAIGLVAAVALWWWNVVGRVLEPYLVTANALPKIALGPILYVWLGPTMSVYGMAITISVIVTILMIYEGFLSVDAEKVKLLRTFGASKVQVLRMVVLPANVPTLVNTAKVTIGLTLVGVIVGEFISSNAGLGYLIIYGSQVFQMDLVMASIVVLLAISTLMYLVISVVERRLLRQR